LEIEEISFVKKFRAKLIKFLKKEKATVKKTLKLKTILTPEREIIEIKI
jgi:hypothetical protein